MKRRGSTLLVLWGILQVILLLGGCTSARQKMHDFKEQFLNYEFRW
jgi:hypothetical protein